MTMRKRKGEAGTRGRGRGSEEGQVGEEEQGKEEGHKENHVL